MDARQFIRRAIGPACAWALMAWAGQAGAAGLAVSPIRVQLSVAKPTAALTVKNNGSTVAVVQLQVMAWTATGDEDHYQPSDDIVATPPIATIPPGQTQIVRVGLSRDAEPDRELAYRLYLEEVPPPPDPDRQGLQVALRIGVPVFVDPLRAARAEVKWRAVRHGADGLDLLATNGGGSHLRLTRLALRAATGSAPLAETVLAGYLLPGQTRHWPVQLRPGLPAGALHLSVTADPVVADVDLEPENP